MPPHSYIFKATCFCHSLYLAASPPPSCFSSTDRYDQMTEPFIPANHRAVVVTDNPKGVKVAEKPVPVVGEDHILVKVRAVALNPWVTRISPMTTND